MNATTPEKPIIVNHCIMNAPIKETHHPEMYDDNIDECTMNICKCGLTTPICLDLAFSEVDTSVNKDYDEDDIEDDAEDYFQEDEYECIYEDDYEDCKYELISISDLRYDYLRYTRDVKDISFESYCNKNHIFYRNHSYIRYLF